MKLLPFLSKSDQWHSCGNLKTSSFRSPEIDFTPEVEDNNNNNPQSIESLISGLRDSDRLFFEPGETSSILNKKAPILNNKDPILNNKDPILEVPYKESEIVSMDSNDPYSDFRRSMEEMMEAHSIKNWAALEELLSWFLKVNGKSNHSYIVGAFIDLLVGLSFAEETNCCSSSASSSFTISHSSLPSSPLSLPSSLSVPTPCSSSNQVDDDDN